MKTTPRSSCTNTILPGGAGFLFGSASGIVRGLPPLLAGGASALQTFAIGTIFSACRSSVLQAWTVDDKVLPSKDLTTASAISGGITGGVVGLLVRGRANVVPGTIMFAIFGAAGQHFYSGWSAPTDRQPKENFWKRMSDKSWTPFKMLTNDEYSDMLKEKMLKVDVEIAILDDKIAALRTRMPREEHTAESDNTQAQKR